MPKNTRLVPYSTWLVLSLPLAAIAWMWYIEVPHAFSDLTLDVTNFKKVEIFETEWLYLLVNGFTLLFPFLLSFDKKVAFYRKWRYVFPAILLTMLVFIPWDIFFTGMAVWGFNNDYFVESLKLLNLPLGEWLFFVTVPYACIFIYECLRCYFPSRFMSPNLELKISWFLTIVFLILGVVNFGKMYTSTTCLLAGFFMLFHLLILKSNYRGEFYVAYLISLIPFFMVNGILTGGFSSTPLVCYNDLENLSIRLVSIPLDDTIYSFLMLMMATSWFEYLKSQKKK
ncbi:MAG: lycopene cyclase domain-containing protein [Bacteroidota bacterium]